MTRCSVQVLLDGAASKDRIRQIESDINTLKRLSLLFFGLDATLDILYSYLVPERRVAVALSS